jgi:glutamyl-tRNA synthetase
MHLQPIMRDATHKLSKRHGDASYEDFIKKGYLKDAIVNYIALLGWSPKDNREKFTLEEMVELFSVEGLSKSQSIFDEAKMRWLNSCYIKDLTDEQFYEYALPFYEKVEYLKGYDLKFLSTLLKNRCEIFSDVEKLTQFMVEFDGFDLNLLCNAKWKTDQALAKQMIPDLIKLCQENFDGLHDGLVAYAESAGYKKGQVLWVFRIAITGAQNTPGGATEMAELFGKEEVIRRLTDTLNRL